MTAMGRFPLMSWSSGLEHSLLTSSEKVLEQMPSRFRLDHEEGYSVGWTFGADDVDIAVAHGQGDGLAGLVQEGVAASAWTTRRGTAWAGPSPRTPPPGGSRRKS